MELDKKIKKIFKYIEMLIFEQKISTYVFDTKTIFLIMYFKSIFKCSSINIYIIII